MMNRLKGYGSMLGKGLLLQMAPGVAKGVIRELFTQYQVTVEKVVDDVKNNRPLLDNIGEEQLKNLKGAGSALGNLDFIDAKFVIDSIKDDFPAVASLFLSWTDANQWLLRQINALKKIAQSDNDSHY
jgi:hypothetical protein